MPHDIKNYTNWIFYLLIVFLFSSCFWQSVFTSICRVIIIFGGLSCCHWLFKHFIGLQRFKLPRHFVCDNPKPQESVDSTVNHFIHWALFCHMKTCLCCGKSTTRQMEKQHNFIVLTAWKLCFLFIYYKFVLIFVVQALISVSYVKVYSLKNKFFVRCQQ